MEDNLIEGFWYLELEESQPKQPIPDTWRREKDGI
jgi:hypothetical protein